MIQGVPGAIKEAAPLGQWRENIGFLTTLHRTVIRRADPMKLCMLAGRAAGWGGWGEG